MRAFYIPVCLLAVILGFSLWAGRYVEQRTGQWISQLEEIDETARQEDWGSAEVRLNQTYRDWTGSQTFFHTIMDHEELDEAETLFAAGIAVCQEQDDADFHQLLAQLMSQLRLLSETQSVSIKNVL